jgi:hypothetical protein
MYAILSVLIWRLLASLCSWIPDAAIILSVTYKIQKWREMISSVYVWKCNVHLYPQTQFVCVNRSIYSRFYHKYFVERQMYSLMKVNRYDLMITKREIRLPSTLKIDLVTCKTTVSTSTLKKRYILDITYYQRWNFIYNNNAPF